MEIGDLVALSARPGRVGACWSTVYHDWIRGGRTLVTDMPIVRPEHLIPPKAKLRRRYLAG